MDGFEAIVGSCRTPLFRTAIALTAGDVNAAQDLVQSALARCWIRWERVRSADSPTAYAKRVLYTVFVSERRRRQPRETPGDLPDVAGPTTGGIDVDMIAAIGSLPPRQRAVIVSRYLDDLSEEATAAQLGCAVGTVKSQAAEALRSLRRSRWLTDDDTRSPARTVRP